MAAVLLFWYTNMAGVTSCDNVLHDDHSNHFALFNALQSLTLPGTSSKANDEPGSLHLQGWF